MPRSVAHSILTHAQMALEEYIKQVKETWTNYTLDLVNYQNKCRLIRCERPVSNSLQHVVHVVHQRLG
jgi:hypothetical protein